MLLALLMLLPCTFVSCGVIKGETVMEYNGYKITEAMYSYWVRKYKLNYSQKYGVNWDEKLPNGLTYAEFTQSAVDAYAQKVLISMYLFDKYELKFTDAQKNSISQKIENLKVNNGGKQGLNTVLEQYGLNIDTLEDIYYEQQKFEIVKDYLFTQGGPMAVTDTDRINYYNDNYLCYDRILIYTEKRPKLNDQGGPVYDTEGNRVWIELSENEKADSKALIEDILSKLRAGTDSFNVLRNNYSEQSISYAENYPDGIILCPNDEDPDVDHTATLIKTIQDLEVGEYGVCSNQNGYGKYIIVRRPLKAFADLTEIEIYGMKNFESYVISEKSQSYFNSITVTVNDSVKRAYSIKTTGMLKDYNL